jgi:hypothetical protein
MKYRIQLSTIILIIFLCSQAFAGTVTINYGTSSGGDAQSTQSTSGGATSQAVSPVIDNPVVANPDTFQTWAPLIDPTPEQPAAQTTETPATEPAKDGAESTPEAAPATAPAKTTGLGAGVGLNVIWSKNVKGYTLPLSYAITPNLKVSVNIPYVSKSLTGEFTGVELTASGLGDIFTSVGYRYGNEVKFVQGITYFGVSIPTGQSKQFEGRQEKIALGSGTYDFSINQTVSRRIGKFRLIGSLGYRYNTKSDYSETDTFGRYVKFENANGNIFSYLLGVDMRTPIRGLHAYLNFSGLNIERSRLKMTDLSNGNIIVDGDRADRLTTLDINPGVKLILTKNIAFRLGLIIPTLTRYDSDAVNPASRDLTIDFGMAGTF